MALNIEPLGDRVLVDLGIKLESVELTDLGRAKSIVVDEDNTTKKRKGNEGYDVATGEYTDLVKAGIVDPKRVTRTALQNAASIAGLLLTTECLITEIPKKEAPPPQRATGGGMGAWTTRSS